VMGCCCEPHERHQHKAVRSTCSRLKGPGQIPGLQQWRDCTAQLQQRLLPCLQAPAVLIS
jgi:hypothetical protein